MQDRKIESLNFLIVTDATFIEDALMLKHISLTGFALAKAIEYGFGNRLGTITDCVAAAVSFANNLVVIGTVAKTQSRVGFQNIATLDWR